VQVQLEIGRPEDVGLVQVNTQLKAFEPVDVQLEVPVRRRRSEVKPTEAPAPVQTELVMVETQHGDKA
jgi:ribonuclease E